MSLLDNNNNSIIIIIIESVGRNGDRGVGVEAGNVQGIVAVMVVVVEGRDIGVRAEVKVHHYRRRHRVVLITIRIIGVHRHLVNFGVGIPIAIGMKVGGGGGIISGDGMVAITEVVGVQAIMVRVTTIGVIALPHGTVTIIILGEGAKGEEEDIIKGAVRIKE